jgi:putative zinc-dependent peptidase DUF5700
MKIRCLLIFSVVMFMAVGVAVCGPNAQSALPKNQVNVTLITDEADAVLQILAKRKANQPLPDADWQRLFSSEGYVRLKRREESMQRAFTDAEFKSFVLSDKLLQNAGALAKTLADWKRAKVADAAGRALDYLPKDAVIRAKIYPVIKPRENSFVFEVNTDPAIFLYLDPAKTKEQFENMLAHELHHIGYGSRCPERDVETAIATRPEAVRNTLRWIGAFGEGFAMLAAAGGPDVHPHKFSPAADRERWDRDMGNFNNDLKQVESFFRDILAGRLKDDEKDKRGFSFFGVQGPWYTVGWRMAVLIEKTFGRERLIECMCDQQKLLATYNEAARRYNSKSAEPLALWSSELIEALR